VLYELITGQPPFIGEHAVQTMRKVRQRQNKAGGGMSIVRTSFPSAVWKTASAIWKKR
jgi:hypothetical protein